MNIMESMALVTATDLLAEPDSEIKSWLGKGSEKEVHHVSFGVDHLSDTYAILVCISLCDALLIL